VGRGEEVPIALNFYIGPQQKKRGIKMGGTKEIL